MRANKKGKIYLQRRCVLHANGEARWVKRLFIVDGSFLSNSLCGSNPALTMQSLATQTAEKVFQLYVDGDSLVGKETPVSSVDSAVKRGLTAAEGIKGTVLGCKHCHGS